MPVTRCLFLVAMLAASTLLSCTRPSEAPLPAQPAAVKRVISLMPTVTEIMFALGAGDRVVGATAHCDFPPAATRISRIGGALPKTTNMEQIVSLQPDLVILTGNGQQGLHAELLALGLDARMSMTVSIEDAFTTIERIGGWIGEPARAARIIEINRQVINQVRERVAGQPRPRVFYQVWDDPLMTAGSMTFLGQLLEIAGGESIFADLDKEYPVISHEDVIDRNPALILGPDYHLKPLTLEHMHGRPGWQMIDAIKSNNVRFLDGQLVSRPGPRIAYALVHIARHIHPELNFDTEAALARTAFEPVAR